MKTTTSTSGTARARTRGSTLFIAAATLAFAASAGCDGDDSSDDDDGASATGGTSGKGGGAGNGGSSGTGGSAGKGGGAGQGGSAGKGGTTSEGGSGGAAGDDAGGAPSGAAGWAGGGGDAGDDGASGSGGAAEGGAGNELEPRQVFRHDTFGNEQFWTEQLRLHEFIQASLDPMTALSVGLKVDADVLPEGILDTVDLEDPATTVALLELGAVVGVEGRVEDGNLVSVGISCALCHSDVDDSVMEGIGSRIDGPANRDLDPGLIISLAPALAENQAARDVYTSWGKGRFDPRYNQDGINAPVLIPPIYGLDGVPLETYTGDGPVSYWNSYVAVTQMGGQGVFFDSRIGVQVFQEPDLVTSKLPALFEYETSLAAPAPAAASFDAAGAARGQVLFAGAAQCSTCHSGEHFTDAADTLHAPEETGMDPVTAERSATGNYRTTPLRALFDHPPYFHDGSAATLAEVVTHYVTALSLTLTEPEQADLVEYLKSL